MNKSLMFRFGILFSFMLTFSIFSMQKDVEPVGEELISEFFQQIEQGNLEEIKAMSFEHAWLINVENTKGQKPIHYAAVNGQLDVLKYLIEEKKGGNAKEEDENGWKLIHIAAQYGKLNILKYLIEEKGVRENEETKDGWKQIHFAAVNGQLDVLKYLIEEKGVSVNEETKGGWKLIHFAARYGKLDILKYLIEEKRVCVNEETKDGWKPIHVAAVNGQLDVLKYLIEEKRVCVNEETKDGWKPIHIAASRDQLKVIRYLILKGAHFLQGALKSIPTNYVRVYNQLQALLCFESLKNKHEFLLEAIKENNFDWTEAVVFVALNRINYIENDFKSTPIEKLFSPIIKIFKTGKNKHLKKCENIEMYRMLCCELFNQGKKNRLVKKAILDNLGIEEKDYEKFYSYVIKNLKSQYKNMDPEAIVKTINEIGKCQINENMAKQLKEEKRITPDVRFVFQK